LRWASGPDVAVSSAERADRSRRGTRPVACDSATNYMIASGGVAQFRLGIGLSWLAQSACRHPSRIARVGVWIAPELAT
jgi:hypothetical protein